MKQFLFCFLSVSILALLQFLYAQAPSLLGVSSQELSLGFVQFDMGVVAIELLKIFLVTSGYLFLFRSAYRSYRDQLASKQAKRIWLAVTILTLASMYLSTLIRYPAAFESFFPPFLNRTLYRSAFYISPFYLELGVGLWALWVLWHCPRRIQALATGICALLLFLFWSPISASRVASPQDPDQMLLEVRQ